MTTDIFSCPNKGCTFEGIQKRIIGAHYMNTNQILNLWECPGCHVIYKRKSEEDKKVERRLKLIKRVKEGQKGR